MLDPDDCENMLVSYLPHLISPQTDARLFQKALALCKRPLSQYYLNMYQIILMRFQSGVLSFSYERSDSFPRPSLRVPLAKQRLYFIPPINYLAYK